MSRRPRPQPAPLPVDDSWDESEVDLAAEEETEFRRRARPVRVRRRRQPNWGRWWQRGWKPLVAGVVVIALGVAANQFLFHSAWFVLAGSDQIQVSGTEYANPARIVRVFAADLGRNVFFIPLARRQQAIEAMPWVRHASVMRVWPARLRVEIVERAPVAFARAGHRLLLVTAAGEALRPPAKANFDFPVLDGVPEVGAAQPNTPAAIAARRPAIAAYLAMQRALDAGGSDHIKDFSEIDVSNPNDVEARVAVPGTSGATTLIHFGDQNFAARYQLFLSQIGAWRQKYPNLVSVDLHYDGEAIVDPGTGTAKTTTRTAAGARH